MVSNKNNVAQCFIFIVISARNLKRNQCLLKLNAFPDSSYYSSLFFDIFVVVLLLFYIISFYFYLTLCAIKDLFWKNEYIRNIYLIEYIYIYMCIHSDVYVYKFRYSCIFVYVCNIYVNRLDKWLDLDIIIGAISISKFFSCKGPYIFLMAWGPFKFLLKLFNFATITGKQSQTIS